MSTIEITGIALAALVFAVAASILGRRLDSVGSWAWAWAVLSVSGLLFEFGGEWMPTRAAAGFLAVLFPGLQLAGTCEYVDRRVPRWLIPGMALIALLRIAISGLGFEAQSHLAVVGFEVAALTTAAWLIYGSTNGQRLAPKDWLLIIGFLMMGVVEAADSILDLRATGSGVTWTVWLCIGLPVGGAQIVLTFDQMQNRLAQSLHERERALEALEESHERFRAIAEHAHDLILESDASNGISYANPQFYATLGYRPEEVLGRDITDFSWDKQILPPLPELADKQEIVIPLIKVRHRDGSPRWIEISARSYVRDQEHHVVMIARDVTERRRADERVRQAQKLESLGLMAGGIAHDFNNLLTGILGNADIALSNLPADEPAREFVEQVIDSSELAAELTRQLQAYSGSSPFEVRPVDVSQELRNRSELMHTAVGERVTLELDLANGLPAVESDPAQLAQVVLNLILNAAEACGEGPGTVRIATGLVRIEESPPIPATGSLESGSYVFVEVADTGHGIDDSIRERLFDPFFTTKANGRGLGLSVVHGVVKMLRGAITVASTPEKGAVFRLHLPTSTREVLTETSPEPVLTGGDRILVLDDNEPVLDFVRKALEQFGYRVYTAETGQEAERIMDERGSEISMVLLDAVLPGESSEVILDRLQRRRPDLPVVLMSGYAEVEAMTRFVRSGGIAGFLAKPFRSETLAARVRQVLDDASPQSHKSTDINARWGD